MYYDLNIDFKCFKLGIKRWIVGFFLLVNIKSIKLKKYIIEVWNFLEKNVI